ncbi:MAG: 4Fe-4S dicluster domain-containing protein [Eggerthellaceae bacterium]|nr:4Fe-4S dicluster domain-containing protein [Eggerthellaceae bacterium]
MGNKLSRRGFVTAGVVAGCTVALGVGTGAGARRGDAVQLRPPGADGELSLQARCNRCQRCVQACPRGVVQPLGLASGLVNVSTPTLLYARDYCDFCMKCVDACPTGALRADALTASNIGVAKVISDACVAWMWAGCSVCEDACPVEGALTMDEHGRPAVDEALCNGCGLCEATCPASSLRAYNPAAAERGIYVVPRASEAAHRAGAITSAQLEEGRSHKATSVEQGETSASARSAAKETTR